MTVIFGFTNNTKKTCFMGADDLEGHGRRRVDKISYVFGRFIVGCVGADVAIEATRLAGMIWSEQTLLRDMSPYKAPTSLDEFARSIAACVPRIAKARYEAMKKAVADGLRTEEQIEELRSQNSTLVVLDVQERQLHELRLGALFPPSPLETLEHAKLPKERIFRFGVNGTKDCGPVSKEALDQPFAWCREQVSLTKEEVEPHRPGAIGELGCCYLARGNNITFKTAFQSVDDAAASWFGLEPPGN